MGRWFTGKDPDDNDIQGAVDRAKRDYSETYWVQHAHESVCATPSAPGRGLAASGPSAPDASTPRRGRRR
ncbi:hypothetical protein POF50_004670 [Streptomyces sp. SL13]|uniref:Uncharacterized protein n=1 Tax=Streptantibioticus silvisoli TaxID=2705255 RepID=A0AA90H4H4_9ACTN|nr:hypothetical protein [Streptantibioticus silvisoli]MDI5968645.1 hypothetical protein [Streptantibioticus silvisoli]